LQDNNRAECEKWLKQAEFDLGAAKNSSAHGDFEWSCFQSQQSAEKALKAFLYLKGKRELLTHSVLQLVKQCKGFDKRFEKIMDCKELDAYYVPTRYPSGLPDEVPHDFFNKEDSEKCVRLAARVLALAKELTRK
jgi:HEPN domain-containing protein